MNIVLNPQHGQGLMGCTDTRFVDSEKFSRIYDCFIAAVNSGLDPLIIWNSLPADVKVDMNYGNWNYVKKV